MQKNKYYLLIILLLLGLIAGGCATQITDPSATGTPVTDSTPPTIQSIYPADSATGVAVNSAITATFSEAIDAATINSATFLLSGGATGTVSYDAGSKTATLKPSANLSYDTTYTVIIKTGVKDSAGNAMALPYAWTFTTGSAPDTTAPTVQAQSPVDGLTGVAINTSITVTFNEPIDTATLGISTFLLSGGIVGTVKYDVPSKTATFYPAVNLSHNTTYTATITSDVKDLSGNALASPYSWTFTTGSESDTTPPTIQTVSPVQGAVAVQINPVITAVFSEEMDFTSFDPTTILLTNSGIKDISYNQISKTVSFRPESNLSYGTTYTVTITGVKDKSGNVIASPYTWTFTTISGQTLIPLDDATKEKIKEAIKTKSFIDFIKYKDALFNLTAPSGVAVTGHVDDNVTLVVSGNMTLDGTMANAEIKNTAAGLVKVDTTNKPVNLSAVTKVDLQKGSDDKWMIGGSSVTDISTTDDLTPEFFPNNVTILLKNVNSDKKIWEATSPDDVFDIKKLPFLTSKTKISIKVIVKSSIDVNVYLYHEGSMDIMNDNGTNAEGDKIFYKEYTVGDKIGLYTGFVEVVSKESFTDPKKFQSKTWVVGYTIQ